MAWWPITQYLQKRTVFPLYKTAPAYHSSNHKYSVLLSAQNSMGISQISVFQPGMSSSLVLNLLARMIEHEQVFLGEFFHLKIWEATRERFPVPDRKFSWPVGTLSALWYNGSRGYNSRWGQLTIEAWYLIGMNFILIAVQSGNHHVLEITIWIDTALLE